MISTKPDDSSLVTPTNTEPDLPLPHGVSLIPEFSVYPVGTEIVNVVWRNDTDKKVGFGASHALDKRVDDKWERVNYAQDNLSWISILYVIAPHSQIDYAYWLVCYVPLETGNYRFVVNFWDQNPPIGSTSEHRIYAEFALV